MRIYPLLFSSREDIPFTELITMVRTGESSSAFTFPKRIMSTRSAGGVRLLFPAARRGSALRLMDPLPICFCRSFRSRTSRLKLAALLPPNRVAPFSFGLMSARGQPSKPQTVRRPVFSSPSSRALSAAKPASEGARETRIARFAVRAA